MTTYELGELVAERRLEATGPDGGRWAVELRIGKPFPDPLPGGDWCCPFQIVGLGAEAVKAAFGIDSVQAILLAMYSLRLHVQERATAGSVRVDFLQLPDLGLRVDP